MVAVMPPPGADGLTLKAAKMGKASTSYLLKEVAEHNKADDLWIVVDGKVYDVTRFLSRHPGGPEVMLAMGGVDATDAIHGALPA